MTVEHGLDDRQTTADIGPNLTAGVTLKAVEALEQQKTFTRAQMAYLVALAYDSGLTQGRADLAEHLAKAESMAEIAACWDEHYQPKPTRKQRIARRHEDMRDAMWRENNRPPWNRTPIEPGYRTGVNDYGWVVNAGGRVNPDVEWPEVAVPGGRELRVVA